ncbi:ABC transporter permease [Brevibacterium casei]|nr:ABC transporter permease [Brevibacterium casei]
MGAVRAIGLGIALAAGFVSATLIINTSPQESLREGIGQSFSRAGVVVMPVTGAAIDPPEVAAVTESLAGVPGVSAVEVTASAVASARGGGIADTDFAVTPAPGDPRLDTFSVVEGSRPQEPTDVVVDTATVADLGVGVGDTLRFTTATARIDTDTDSMPVYRGPRHSATDFTVVGIAEMGDDPTFVGMPRALTTGASYREHFARSGDVAAIQLGLSSDADPETVRSAIETRIADSVLRDRMETMTVDEAVDRRVAEFSEAATSSHGCFARLCGHLRPRRRPRRLEHVLGHRRRSSPRTRPAPRIGASRRQLYGSVLVEGVFVGLLGSLLGVIAGIGVSALLVAVATRVWEGRVRLRLAHGAGLDAAGRRRRRRPPHRGGDDPAGTRRDRGDPARGRLAPFDVPSAPTSQSRARVLSGWGASSSAPSPSSSLSSSPSTRPSGSSSAPSAASSSSSDSSSAQARSSRPWSRGSATSSSPRGVCRANWPRSTRAQPPPHRVDSRGAGHRRHARLHSRRRRHVDEGDVRGGPRTALPRRRRRQPRHRRRSGRHRGDPRHRRRRHGGARVPRVRRRRRCRALHRRSELALGPPRRAGASGGRRAGDGA